MTDEAVENGRSYWRGHAIIFADGRWLYEDTREPTPGFGGEHRPCGRCGQREWSGTGSEDACLGILPNVTNACCGHGDLQCAYVVFDDGTELRGQEAVDYFNQTGNQRLRRSDVWSR